MDLNELRSEKGELIRQMWKCLDNAESLKRPLNQMERDKYKKADERVDEINELLARHDKLDKLETEGRKIVNPLPNGVVGPQGRTLENNGFSGLGEFLHSLYQFRKEQVHDDRLDNLRSETREQSMGSGAGAVLTYLSSLFLHSLRYSLKRLSCGRELRSFLLAIHRMQKYQFLHSIRRQRKICMAAWLSLTLANH